MRYLGHSDTPCCGSTRYHRLTCGHLVRTSRLSSAFSHCSENCLTPYRAPPGKKSHPLQASFLCPICYEERLHGHFEVFKREVKELVISEGMPRRAVLRALKEKYEERDVSKYNCWWDVELGITRYVDICEDTYRCKRDEEGSRGCKGVEADEDEAA